MKATLCGPEVLDWTHGATGPLPLQLGRSPVVASVPSAVRKGDPGEFQQTLNCPIPFRTSSLSSARMMVLVSVGPTRKRSSTPFGSRGPPLVQLPVGIALMN